MVTFTADDDRRQSYAANQARRAVNAARQRKATVGNVDWAMSRPADWYQDRENLASIKDTLANQQGNRDFWTTDQDESRNMYQMLMNQMKGGDRGARLIDTRGLPAGARRTGRTLFTDPAKSQGFLGDVGSLFTGKNKAAVRAQEYNPFPKAGFGKDWYRDQFPIESGLGSFMEAAENFIPGATWAKQFLPKRNRVPLDRDLSWVPEGVGAYDELPMMEFEDEVDEVSDLDLLAPYVENSQLGISESPYYGRGELSEDFDYSQFPSGVDEDITENLEEIIEEPEEITETFTDLGDTHSFTKEFGWGAGDYEDVQEYVTALIGDPDSTWYKMDQDELVKILIKQNRIKEK
jgi:hypothetical protein